MKEVKKRIVEKRKSFYVKTEKFEEKREKPRAREKRQEKLGPL